MQHVFHSRKTISHDHPKPTPPPLKSGQKLSQRGEVGPSNQSSNPSLGSGTGYPPVRGHPVRRGFAKHTISGTHNPAPPVPEANPTSAFPGGTHSETRKHGELLYRIYILWLAALARAFENIRMLRPTPASAFARPARRFPRRRTFPVADKACVHNSDSGSSGCI